MSTPELQEFGDYRSGFSPEDQRFLETVQYKLYERPLMSKLGERVLDIFNDSKTPKVLLVSAVGTISAGLVLGDPVIFTGGVGLFSFWQTSNLASYWRAFLTIGS